MFRIARALILTLAFGAVAELGSLSTAEARAGRGRSSGGSSSYQRQAPMRQQQAMPPPASMPSQPRSGGFLRGMAGGIAGGFLGSMLFSSMGHAAGGVGGMGGGGGGIGLLEIVLFAGLAYLGFRWWRSRQQLAVAPAFARSGSYGETSVPQQGLPTMQAYQPEGIEPEAASELFFKVQGAWTRRDLTPVRGLLGDELHAELARDVAELKTERRINRLENITVRRTEVVRSWHDEGLEHSTVRVAANLLDYTVDEGSGQVVDGSDTIPVRFEEEWTFARSPTRDWYLVRIDQV